MGLTNQVCELRNAAVAAALLNPRWLLGYSSAFGLAAAAAALLARILVAHGPAAFDSYTQWMVGLSFSHDIFRHIFTAFVFPNQSVTDGMHSLNADTALKNMYFPWYRMAFVVFWSFFSYVMFQWVFNYFMLVVGVIALTIPALLNSSVRFFKKALADVQSCEQTCK